MDIKIRDKVFKINLVNNEAQNLYGEIRTLSLQLVEYVSEVKEITEEFDIESKDLDRKERKALRLKYKTELNEMKAEAGEWSKSIQTNIELLMTELLIHNNYEFDKNWWIHKISQEDKENFLTTCMKKDVTKGKKATPKKKGSTTRTG